MYFLVSFNVFQSDTEYNNLSTSIQMSRALSNVWVIQPITYKDNPSAKINAILWD